MSGDRALPAYCHSCEMHIDIPLDDLVVQEDGYVVAVCPIGKHFASGPVSAWLAYRLHVRGARSLADECSGFLADRRTDIL